MMDKTGLKIIKILQFSNLPDTQEAFFSVKTYWKEDIYTFILKYK